jgi:hypothetical protein
MKLDEMLLKRKKSRNFKTPLNRFSLEEYKLPLHVAEYSNKFIPLKANGRKLIRCQGVMNYYVTIVT